MHLNNMTASDHPSDPEREDLAADPIALAWARKATMTYYTIEQAAAQLAMTPQALQKRCTRNARIRGSDVIAELGDGVIAVKFGRVWRIRFPDRRVA
jgi:hypothetical protein